MLELAEAQIDADKEVGRIFVTLDRAELQTFYHRCRAAQLAAGKNLDLDAAIGGFRKNLGELVPKFFLHVATCDDRPFQRVFGTKRGRHKRSTCGRKNDDDCRDLNTDLHDVLPKDSGCYLFCRCRTIC